MVLVVEVVGIFEQTVLKGKEVVKGPNGERQLISKWRLQFQIDQACFLGKVRM